jgi:hypothetical protein
MESTIVVFAVKFCALEGDSYILELFSSLEKARNYLIKDQQILEDGYKELAHMKDNWSNGLDSYVIKEMKVL